MRHPAPFVSRDTLPLRSSRARSEDGPAYINGMGQQRAIVSGEALSYSRRSCNQGTLVVQICRKDEIQLPHSHRGCRLGVANSGAYRMFPRCLRLETRLTKIQPTVGEDAGKDLAGRSPQSQDGVPIVPLPGGSSAPKASSPQPSGQNSTQKKPPPSPATVPNKPPPPEAAADEEPPPVQGILNVNGIDFWLMLDNIAKGLHSFHDS